MDHAELLAYAVEALESLDIGYFVTGSSATIVYGEPRFTNDIDMVIDLPMDRVADFCDRFPEPDYYVSVSAVADAVRNKRQFNVIHIGAGLKIDFILLTDVPLDASRRQRVRSLPVLADRQVNFASPEDVTVKKLTHYQLDGSDKHHRDIVGVLRIQGDAVDREYVSRWSERLGVREIWLNVLGQLEAVDDERRQPTEIAPPSQFNRPQSPPRRFRQPD